jgi:hypothetical protein
MKTNEKTCPLCGINFIPGGHKNQMYCSYGCKNNASRRRFRANHLAEERVRVNEWMKNNPDSWRKAAAKTKLLSPEERARRREEEARRKVEEKQAAALQRERDRRDRKPRKLRDDTKMLNGCLNPGCRWAGPYHPSMLEFHHLNPSEKAFPIASNAGDGHSPRTLFSEMRKCTIVCSNCHRLITFEKLDTRGFRPINLSLYERFA